MRIAIDLTPLYNRKRTGVEVYGIDLYKALLSTSNEIIPIFHVKNELDFNKNAYIIPFSNRVLLENFYLSRAIRKINPDVAFFPIFPPPIDLYFFCDTKVVPTIHDLAFLKYRRTLNFAAKFYLTPKYLMALKKSFCILSVSETVKNEMKRYSNSFVFNGGNVISSEFSNAKYLADEGLLEKWKLKKGEYIISVSTIEPRKNFRYLLTVFIPYLKKTRKKLVLVGRKGWQENSVIQGCLDKSGVDVIFTDFVSFSELISLYRFSFAFSLLSVDEGFGRTPYEAVACGCERIVLSDIKIFHETFDDSALFLPLKNIAQAQDILMGNLDSYKINSDVFVPFDTLNSRISSFLNQYCAYR